MLIQSSKWIILRNEARSTVSPHPDTRLCCTCWWGRSRSYSGECRRTSSALFLSCSQSLRISTSLLSVSVLLPEHTLLSHSKTRNTRSSSSPLSRLRKSNFWMKWLLRTSWVSSKFWSHSPDQATLLTEMSHLLPCCTKHHPALWLPRNEPSLEGRVVSATRCWIDWTAGLRSSSTHHARPQ